MQKCELTFTVERMYASRKLGDYIVRCDNLEHACSVAARKSVGYLRYAVCSYRRYIDDDGTEWYTRKIVMEYFDGEEDVRA